MSSSKWHEKLLLKKMPLNYRLNIIFGLFFIFPTLGFIYFGLRYKILENTDTYLFFLGLLLFSLLGIFMLRKSFDEISGLSREVQNKLPSISPEHSKYAGEDEIQNLIRSFRGIETEFNLTLKELRKKSSDLSVLKDLSDLCYITFDPGEILYVALEKALMLTKSQIGSILILEHSEPKHFIVKASIGLDEFIKPGDIIDFETSIAKYAVINKSPLIVEDIEKDKRFGRANRCQYQTKSFICMPLKTSKDIIGVMTISKREDGGIYKKEDGDILIPLVSNASFTYENIRLTEESKKNAAVRKAMSKIFGILTSSLKGSELLNAVLEEMQNIIPFNYAVIIIKNGISSAKMEVAGKAGDIDIDLSVNDKTDMKNSIIERCLTEMRTIIIHDINRLSVEQDKILCQNQASKCCLLSPMIIAGKPKGVLAISAGNMSVFHDTVRLIEWIANGICLSMERAYLSDMVHKRARELDSIKEIGRALASSTFDITKVLDYTMDMIRTLINADAGSLFLIKDNELESAVSFIKDSIGSDKIRLKMGQGIAGYVASRGEAIIVNNTDKSPLFYPEVDKTTGFKTRSILCVPMISQGKVIGVIEILNKKNGEFGSDDEDIIQSIASSVSIAIENARLYKETVEMAEHERGMRNVFQKFVPKQVLEKIIRSNESDKMVINELKTLTLLNIDIRSSSDFVKNIGPQKTVALLNNFFSEMGTIVFKYNGIVDKYLGDGFLAIFGAPVSSTLDGQNAIDAALAMRDAVAGINRDCKEKFGETITMGISIHSGEVVVGNIGFDMKMDYTVIGDPVNMVFRLQEFTKPYKNGILISENACRATLCKLELKELNEKLGNEKIFQLLGKSSTSQP